MGVAQPRRYRLRLRFGALGLSGRARTLPLLVVRVVFMNRIASEPQNLHFLASTRILSAHSGQGTRSSSWGKSSC